VIRFRGIATVVAVLASATLPAFAQPPSSDLAFTPEAGIVGAPVTARATGLVPDTHFNLVWKSGDPRWNVRDGKFFGITATPTARVIAQGTSDVHGSLALHFLVPEDFGYLHDVELRAAGDLPTAPPAAGQGFTVVPHLTLATHAGRSGAPIAITATGLGYRFYEVVWHLLYDGAQTGWLSAVTTHGTAHVTIPASGAVGVHSLQAVEGAAAPYLNGEQAPNAQAAIPQTIGDTYRILPGPALQPPAPRAQIPKRDGPAAPPATHAPALATDFASGPVGAPIVVTGVRFAPGTAVALSWETLVGNRLSGNGWTTQEHAIAQVTVRADGTFAVHVRTPEDLGGAHRLIARASDLMVTSVYTIVPSVDPIAPEVVRPGETITIHLHGVGWSETSNSYTTVVDNGTIGYECGFNTGGDVIVRLRAPGPAGAHFVDLYPTIYRGEILGPGSPPSGSQFNGTYFLLPMLNAIDHPGEVLPAYHLRFDVH
jgi:hypothetical protein